MLRSHSSSSILLYFVEIEICLGFRHHQSCFRSNLTLHPHSNHSFHHHGHLDQRPASTRSHVRLDGLYRHPSLVPLHKQRSIHQHQQLTTVPGFYVMCTLHKSCTQGLCILQANEMKGKSASSSLCPHDKRKSCTNKHRGCYLIQHSQKSGHHSTRILI